jgi:hypothetical protein
VFEIKSLNGVLDQRMFGSQHDERRAEYTSLERGTPADPFLGRVSHTGIILEASDWLLGAKGPSSGEGGWPKRFPYAGSKYVSQPSAGLQQVFDICCASSDRRVNSYCSEG